MDLKIQVTTNDCPRCGGSHINMRVEETKTEHKDERKFTSICPHKNETIYVLLNVIFK